MQRQIRSLMTAFAILGIFACGIGSKTSPPSPSGTTVMQEGPKEEAQEPSMGPYDLAVIALEDVPEPDPSRIWSYSFIEGEGKGLEVLRVIKDPRDVPLERFLYFNTPWKSSSIEGIPSGVVKHADAEEIIQRFENEEHMAVAVYVHLSTRDKSRDDPLYVINPRSDPWEEGERWSPWSELAVVDTKSDLRFPCMPQRIADPGEEYRIAETGAKFDPSSYLPPKPWYPEIALKIQAGEVREGWILCLAPDIPVEDIRIVLRAEGGEEDYWREFLYWTKLSGSRMGDWVLLEKAEVVGWQRPDKKRAQAFDDVPFAQDEPNAESPVIYEGPLWISVTMGRTYAYGHPQVTNKRMKLNIQFYFDGMEELLQEWERMALKKTFNIELYSDVTMNNDFAYLPEVQLHATDFWLDVIDVPGDLETVWVKILEREEGPQVWKTLIPVWRLELIDATEEITSSEDICRVTECYDLSGMVYDRSRGKLTSSPWEELDGQAPIIPFNQYAMGIRILGATITDEPYFFSENGPDLRMLEPKYYQDRKMIVEIESKYGVIGQLPSPNLWDVQCVTGNEIEYMGYLVSKPLQGDLDGVFATSGLVNSEIRAATINVALTGEIIGTCPAEDMLLFKFYTGPAWRIQ